MDETLVLCSEPECFYDGTGEELPKGGEDSREVRTRNPVGAVSFAAHVGLAGGRNRHCFLGSADCAGF